MIPVPPCHASQEERSFGKDHADVQAQDVEPFVVRDISKGMAKAAKSKGRCEQRR